MKKFLVIMIVTLMLGSQSTKAQQKYRPVMPYNIENGHSVSEVKTFIAEKSDLSIAWKNNMYQIINDGLATCGESLRVGDTNQDVIFSHLNKRYRKYGKFVNSHQTADGNDMTFYNDENWSGYVWVFEYNGCVIDLWKDICINLVKISVVVPKLTSTTTTTTVASNGQPINVTTNVFNNVSSNSEVKSSGNSENTIEGAGPQQAVEPQYVGTSYGQQQVYYPQQQQVYIPQQQQGYYQPQQQRQFNLGIGLNFDRQTVVQQQQQQRQQHQRYYQQPQPQPRQQPSGIPAYPRGMPGGIPFINGNGNGNNNNGGGGGNHTNGNGLPAPTRGMPNGIVSRQSNYTNPMVSNQNPNQRSMYIR